MRKSLTSITIKTLDLNFFSLVGKSLGEFPKDIFEYEKCHAHRTGVIIQRKVLITHFCRQRILFSIICRGDLLSLQMWREGR